MIGRTNAVSKPGVELSLVVSVTSGAAVTATKGSKTVNGTAAGGSCVLSLPEAGTWSVKATLNGQTSDTKSVSVVDSYAVALTFFSATITVNVDSGASVTLKKGGTTIATKTSNGTAVFTVTETGAYTVTATKNGQTTSGSVNVVSGTTSYSLTLSFVSSTLNNNEWSVIKSGFRRGTGRELLEHRDRKAVTLNGTVGKLSLSNVTTYAFIIGFNHNASVEGANRIHFQLAKTALSGGTDVCFCDNQYGPDSGWSSPGCGLFRYEREQHQLRRMEKLANAYKHLRDEPLELFRDDYCSHSGGAPCRPPSPLPSTRTIRQTAAARRRATSRRQRITFSSSRSSRFSVAFPTETRTRRTNKRSTPIIPPGIAKSSTSTTARVPPLIGGSVPRLRATPTLSWL